MITFAARGTAGDVEQGAVFQPKFDADGLIPVIVADAATAGTPMFAWTPRRCR
jgi:phosphoribosyl-AMP cyclohydrolase